MLDVAQSGGVGDGGGEAGAGDGDLPPFLFGDEQVEEQVPDRVGEQAGAEDGVALAALAVDPAGLGEHFRAGEAGGVERGGEIVAGERGQGAQVQPPGGFDDRLFFHGGCPYWRAESERGARPGWAASKAARATACSGISRSTVARWSGTGPSSRIEGHWPS